MPNAETSKQWTIFDYLAVARYEGPVDAHIDFDRLQGQTLRIYNLMSDQIFRTLQEIEELTGYPQASISAQLRHLKKLRFGGHTVNKQRRAGFNVWEYQLIPRTGQGENKSLNESIGELNPRTPGN